MNNVAASSLSEDNPHYWVFKITNFQNPSSSKQVTTQWAAKFVEINAVGEFFDIEFVKPFSAVEDADTKLFDEGLLTTDAFVLDATYDDTPQTCRILVLGEYDSDTDMYNNAEIQFSFDVENPIPVSGYL